MNAGEYCISVAHVGTLPVPAWEVFFGRSAQGMRDLSFYVWAISDGETIGLIDTGIPPAPADRADLVTACQQVDDRSIFHDLRSLDDALKDLSLKPDDIDFVCITQTISYHTGGLMASWLPRATVYMARRGVEEMLVDPPGHPAVNLYFTSDSWAFIRDLAIDNRLRLVDAPTEVVAGVTFIPTGGHHPGSAGVSVATREGSVGILETAFVQENIDTMHPIGIAESTATARRAMREFGDSCDEVLAIHDPSHLARFAPQ